jgi:hypothetical protein
VGLALGAGLAQDVVETGQKEAQRLAYMELGTMSFTHTILRVQKYTSNSDVPEPVFATDMMSFLSSATGHEIAWIGEGVSNPSLCSKFLSLGENGVSSNDMNGWYWSALAPFIVT